MSIAYAIFVFTRIFLLEIKKMAYFLLIVEPG
jgi:hypothetical protein